MESLIIKRPLALWLYLICLQCLNYCKINGRLLPYLRDDKQLHWKTDMLQYYTITSVKHVSTGSKKHKKDPDILPAKNLEERCSVVTDVTPVISGITTYNWGLSLIQILQIWNGKWSRKKRTTITNLNLTKKGSFAKYFVANKLDF